MVTKVGLRVEGQVCVELVEQEYVKTSDSISFVEPRQALFVYSLKGLKVISVDWWPEGKSHSYNRVR